MDIFSPAPPVDFLLPFLRLPNVRWCLGMTIADGATVYPDDPLGSAHPFTINGTPGFGTTDAGLPFLDLNGTTDYLSAADGVWNSSFPRGFTLLVVMQRTVAAAGALISKLGASGNTSYSFYLSSTTVLRGKLTPTGADADAIAADVGIGSTLTAPRLVAMRWTPGTSLKTWGGAATTPTDTIASVPAAVFDSTAALEIGRHPAGSQFFNGKLMLAAGCGSLISDAYIDRLRGHVAKFGVL